MAPRRTSPTKPLPAPMTDADLEAERASRQARAPRLERILVRFPGQQRVIEEINFAFEHAPHSVETRGIEVVGPKGAGKSTISKVVAAQHPTYRGEDGTIRRPVMLATVPANATPLFLAANLLKGMQDPLWAKGNLQTKTSRLIDALRKSETQLLMLDEIQQFQDGASPHVLEAGVSWLKNLLKDNEVKFACVVLGLEGQTSTLMTANSGQLGELFGDSYVLGPLPWVDTTDLEKNTFRVFLDELDRLLPFPSRSNLAEEELAWRCYVATGGSIRHLMRLVRYAGHQAIGRGESALTTEGLSVAFDRVIAGERAGIPNSFNGPQPELPTKANANVERNVVTGAAKRGRGRPPQASTQRVRQILDV